MMRRIAFVLGGPILLAAMAAGTTSASAQCRLCEGQAGVLQAEEPSLPLQVEVESGLKFDQLVLFGAGEGVAVLRPDGTRIVSGSLTGFNGTALVGSVVVRGEPGRMVRVELPSHIELHSITGAQVRIDDLITDLPAMPRLDSSGRLSFRFGGRLKVNGDADGVYRGDLSVTADYL